MGRRQIPVNAPQAPVRPEQVARLEAMRRLATGVAHSLNNAFTTVIGEASFLLEDRKHDDLVVEACQSILVELERCSMLTRALQALRGPGQSGSGEVDMVRLIQDLSMLLSETLGRHNNLEVEAPDDLLLVEGDAGELELLVLTLAHYATDKSRGPSDLRIAVEAEPKPRMIRLCVTAVGTQQPALMAEAVLDPSRAPDALTRLMLENAARIVSEHGGSRYACQIGPDAWATLILLPALQHESYGA